MTIGQAFLKAIEENEYIKLKIKNNPGFENDYHDFFSLGFVAGFKNAGDVAMNAMKKLEVKHVTSKVSS